MAGAEQVFRIRLFKLEETSLSRPTSSSFKALQWLTICQSQQTVAESNVN